MKRSKILLFLILFLAIVLRLYNISGNPPALYWDEASLGYNAFSILKSGMDEHGEFLPLDRFIAFGDYKPPGYIYAAVPFIVLFGLNELSVRLPSVVSAVLAVFVIYQLTHSLFKNKKIALLSSFLLAVSPWSLHLSRGAFEANLAAFFNLAAIYLFLIRRKRTVYFIFSVIFFMLAFYTFNANRIISPLLLISLIFLNSQNKIQAVKEGFLAVILMVLLVLPSLSFLNSRESKLRLQEVSIFNNSKPVEIANQRIELDGGNILAKIIHNRRFSFLSDYLKHYFDNFSGRFLITHGDVNPRLAVQGMGQLYFIELIPLSLGILGLILSKHRSLKILLPWLLIVPLPAAAARETPHSLRILSLLPVLLIFIAYGLNQIFNWLKKYSSQILLFSVLIFTVLLYTFNIAFYFHLYHLHFPVKWSGEWQYGYKEMVEYVLNQEDSYDRIYVSEALGRPYIYFAFYRPYLPADFRKARMASRDWFGFWSVEQLGKISFDISQASHASGRVLAVFEGENKPPEFRLVKEVYDLSGKTVFSIAEK